jgi:hypothetical protein
MPSTTSFSKPTTLSFLLEVFEADEEEIMAGTAVGRVGILNKLNALGVGSGLLLSPVDFCEFVVLSIGGCWKQNDRGSCDFDLMQKAGQCIRLNIDTIGYHDGPSCRITTSHLSKSEDIAVVACLIHVNIP